MPVQWRKEIRGLTRHSFVTRHNIPFLLVLDGNTNGDLAQHLSLITQDMEEEPQIGEPGSVVPLVKADTNPYDTKIIVGRARNCDAVLRHESVSKFHAEIRLTDLQTATVTDRGSRNGTKVNDKNLDHGTHQPIASGDKIRFGAVFTIFLDPARLYDALI